MNKKIENLNFRIFPGRASYFPGEGSLFFRVGGLGAALLNYVAAHNKTYLIWNPPRQEPKIPIWTLCIKQLALYRDPGFPWEFPWEFPEEFPWGFP